MNKVLTIGKDISYEKKSLDDMGFDKSPKSTKILLFNPPVDFSVFYGDNAMDLSDTKSSSPPIGILHLASMLQEYGYPTKVVDAHADGLSLEDIADIIEQYAPDVVGVTAMTIMISAANEIFKIAKEVSDATTILGGVHVTAEPVETLQRYSAIDFAVIGEGEIVLIEFLEQLAKGQISDVASLVWRDGEHIKVNKRKDFYRDLDHFPFPAFDLVGERLFSHYRLSVFGTKQFRSIGLVTSRGCTGMCTFCDLGVVGRGYRIMTAPYLIHHLKELNAKYDVNDLLFYDDMFTGNRKRLEDFCHAMIEAGNPFTWSCCSRVDFVQYLDIIELMRDAGCHTIEFGVESGCQRILDSMRKNVTKEKIKHVIETATRAGITTKANFILGHLGETHDSIEETIRFACSLDVNYVQHTHLVPLPGSETYRLAKNYGKFDPSWDKMNTFLINFIPTGFTEKQLLGYSKKFWRKFYMRPRVIKQQLSKIKTKEDVYRLWLAIKSFFKVTILRKIIKKAPGLIH